MKRIEFGANSTKGTRLYIDPERLLDTRLLVMASSGGGKSYALRKLVESLHGQVQIIVLDIEGEFGTLRSHYPFVVAGKGGDIAADPRYAEPMARKLLELRADTIIDLYELKQHERIRFVKLFLESMVNAPKELWHPVVVVLDEAHIFAPEKGSSESLGAVIDMASRGRKRGFCLVAATQRLSKLHKDVAAECQNKLIGLANLGLDRKRAAEELGLVGREEILAMRDLVPGAFLGVGPAFDFRGLAEVRVGKVKTAHPKSGAGRLKVHTPAPSGKVKAMLAKLADMPKEEEAKATDMAALRAQVQELKAALVGARKQVMPELPKTDWALAVKHAGLNGYELGKAAQRKADFDGVENFRKFMKFTLSGIDLTLGEELLKLCPKLPMPMELPKLNLPKDYSKGFGYGKGMRDPMGHTTPEERKDIKWNGKIETPVCGICHKNESPGLGQMCHSCQRKGGLLSKPSHRAGVSLDMADEGMGIRPKIKPLTLFDKTSGLLPTLADARQRMRHSLGAETDPHGYDLGKAERSVLAFLNLHPGKTFPLRIVGPMAGYRQGGALNNAVGKLVSRGFVQRGRLAMGEGAGIMLPVGVDVRHLVEGYAHTLDEWIAKLGRCERLIYELVLGEPGVVFSLENVLDKIGYKAGGSFNNALGRLNTLGLIERHPGQGISLNTKLL